MHFKSWRKVLIYKPKTEFSDFDNIKNFPWLFKKFPNFSLTLNIFGFPWLFPDRGNPEQGKWKCKSSNRSSGEISAGIGAETAEMKVQVWELTQ